MYERANKGRGALSRGRGVCNVSGVLKRLVKSRAVQCAWLQAQKPVATARHSEFLVDRLLCGTPTDWLTDTVRKGAREEGPAQFSAGPTL